MVKYICIIGAMLTGLLAGRLAAAQASGDDEHHTIDEIIVSATPLERTVEQLAQPTSVLSGDALARRQSTSVGETLAEEPGVSASYFGPVASRPVIRGQFGERVRVLANGLDALDASALSEDHAVSIDSILAERVEVVRGPATLLYGSGAAGGLVNIVDSRIPERPLQEPLSGTFAAGLDSATGRESGALRLDGGTESFALHADWFRRDTDNVEIPGFAESARRRAQEQASHDANDDGEEGEAYGVVENTDSKTEGGAAAITITGDEGYVGLSVSRYTSDYGIPGTHAHDDEHEEAVRVDLDQTRYDLAGEIGPVGILDGVRFRVARNDYQHLELEGAEIGTAYDTSGIDSRFEFRHRPGDAFEGAVGLQYKRIDFNAAGDEAFVPASLTEQTSVFAFEEWAPGDAIVLQASARAEQQALRSSGLPAYDDTAFGASLGAVWSVSGAHDLSVNLALTERHPNSTELYADGPHLAVQRYEIGSVALGTGLLDKELSTNLDLTLRGVHDRFEYTLTAFINLVSDYIVLRPRAAEIDELPVFEYGQTDVDMYGFEAEALVELFETPGGHLHASFMADFVHAEEAETGGYLPRIPPLRFGAGLHYTYGSFETALDGVYHAEQDHTAANELPTDAYTLIGVEASYRFGETLLLFVNGTNLSDEDARRHTSPLKDQVPLAGALDGCRYSLGLLVVDVDPCRAEVCSQRREVTREMTPAAHRPRVDAFPHLCGAGRVRRGGIILDLEAGTFERQAELAEEAPDGGLRLGRQ